MADNNYTWNQFNSDFSIPAGNDAARVFHEAKASLDTWIKNNLADLQDKMTSQLNASLIEFNQELENSKKAVATIQAEVVHFSDEIQKLDPKDPQLGESVAKLKTQIGDTRKAMQEAAEKWEEHGKAAYKTVSGIAKTMMA